MKKFKLNQKQKEYIINDLFKDDDYLIDFYNHKLSKDWIISLSNDVDFPYKLTIDKEFTDLLGREYVDKILNSSALGCGGIYYDV